jgi:hypothetical protein
MEKAGTEVLSLSPGLRTLAGVVASELVERLI